MSYYKPYFVGKGDPLLFDCDALMDMAASHIEIPLVTYTAANSNVRAAKFLILFCLREVVVGP